jgi:enoyl-CoA hydratase/carnithine racemase
MTAQIATRRQDAVLIVTLNRPEKKNALTGAMYEALATALRHADEDSAVHAIVLEGAGAVFCAGNDVRDFAAGGEGLHAAVRFLLQLVDQAKPIVAAVDGPAIGIGTTMLLHVDYVAASSRARFQLPFVNLALTPEGGSTLLLPALVGSQRASEWLLFGDAIDAETARAAGFVNAVVTPEEVAAFALARAQAIAAKPPGAVVMTKRLLRERMRGEVKEAIQREAESFVERLSSPEAAQAFAAFLARGR